MRLKGTEEASAVCLCNPVCLIRSFILFIVSVIDRSLAFIKAYISER